MLYFVLARKTFAAQLQYRATHLLKMLASALIGFLYASVWLGIGQDHALGDGYDSHLIFSYIAFNQATLWIVGGVTNSLGLEESVRTGRIALDLMRPAGLFPVLIAKEFGYLGYQLLYKSLPLVIIYSITMTMYVPKQPPTYVWLVLALGLAAYLSLCMQYLTGLAALWTTESRWIGWLSFALYSLLSGFFIPLEWMPGVLQTISRYSPYSSLQYVPTSIYLEKGSPASLLGSLLWCTALTSLALTATRLARRRIDIQGG